MTEIELLQRLDKISSFEPITLPLFDIEKEAVVGEKTIDGLNASYLNRAIYLLSCMLSGNELYFPLYKNEEFSLLAISGKEKRLYHFSLDSENERAVWRLSELAESGYEIALIRGKSRVEHTKLNSISISELFSPLNF